MLFLPAPILPASNFHILNIWSGISVPGSLRIREVDKPNVTISLLCLRICVLGMEGDRVILPTPGRFFSLSALIPCNRETESSATGKGSLALSWI